MSTQEFSTKTAAETEKLAESLLLDILNKKVVLLSGQLGSGKTTFMKGLAKALGVTEMIKSPTYAYLHKYPILEVGILNLESRNPNSKFQIPDSSPSTLYHFDLYRLPQDSSDPEQTAASIGLEEALSDPHSIVVIEWPERLPIQEPYTSLRFEKKPDHHLITYRTST